MVNSQTVKGGESMATTRPQVAGQVDPTIKERIDRLPLSMAKLVEYGVLKVLPEIEQAVQHSKGGAVILAMPASKPLKPSSK
jgi:hypothetical protein